MKKICNEDEQEFIDFINYNVYSNTYMIGNYYKYGLDNINVQFYKSEGPIKYILMRYFTDFVFYTNIILTNIELNDILTEIEKTDFRVLTGNEFSIEQIVPLLKFEKVRKTILMTYTKSYDDAMEENSKIKKVSMEHKNQMLLLLQGIEEFGDKYHGINGSNRVTRMINDDIVYGYFSDGKIIGSLTITAKSNETCMITDVCVDKMYRNQGISKEMMNHIIRILLKSKVKNINLYVDNLIALDLYRKVGFSFVENYLAIYK